MNLNGTTSTSRRLSAGCLLSLLLLLAVLGPAAPVLAATTNDFLIQPLLPENQVDPDKSYFDLRMEPGQEQVVQLLVSNPGAKEITVTTTLNTATTSRNGLINYTRDAEPDDSLAIPITGIARVLDSPITLDAGQSATVDIAIAMPDTPFDGVLLGGLNVQAEVAGDEEEEAVQGISLQNEFLYVIGLKLSQTDTAVEPDLALRGIEPGLLNYRTMVGFSLQNFRPVVMKNMQVQADVYAGNSGDPLRSLTLASAEMAPNSTGAFVIDWESSRIDPGDYRLHLVVRHEDRVWEWNEPFTISGSEAGDLNGEALGIQRDRTWLYILLGVLLLLLIALLAYLLGRRGNRDRA